MVEKHIKTITSFTKAAAGLMRHKQHHDVMSDYKRHPKCQQCLKDSNSWAVNIPLLLWLSKQIHEQQEANPKVGDDSMTTSLVNQ